MLTVVISVSNHVGGRQQTQAVVKVSGSHCSSTETISFLFVWFFKIISLLGYVGSYLWHVGSWLHHVESFTVVHGLSSCGAQAYLPHGM